MVRTRRPMSQLGRTQPMLCCSANGRYRRISPVSAHSGEGLLSEPTAGTQPCRREPLFMPHTCRSQYRQDRLSSVEAVIRSPSSVGRSVPVSPLSMANEVCEGRESVWLLVERIQQRLRLSQIGRVEAFGEPAVDWREKVAGFGVTALVAPEPGEARSCTQFPELGFLLHGDAECFAIQFLGGLGMPLSQQQLAFVPMELRLQPAL